jgi:predicted RNase H-like nuclease (RuvC/YqgF family)
VVTKRTYTIVGVDPGTTTAFAVLDLNGHVLDVASSRSWGFSELVGLLIESGHPLIIATDKNPTPATVERIKRSFSAILHTPASSLSVEQKLRDTKLYNYANEHERDALAAAIDAARSIKNKLENVEKKTPADIEADELQMLVLRGHTVDSAVSLLKKPLASVDRHQEEQIPARQTDLLGPDILYFKALVKRQDDQISRLSSYVAELQRSLQASEAHVLKLENKVDVIRSEEAKNVKLHKEITFRQKEIDRLSAELVQREKANKRLQNRLLKLKQIGVAERDNAVKAVKIIRAFNREAIETADEQFGLDRSIVLFEDASGGGTAAAELLASKRIRAVVVKNEMSNTARATLFQADIPVFSMKELPLKPSGSLITIDNNALELMIEKSKTEITNAKQRRQLDHLQSLLESYKHERMTGANRND